MRGPSPSPINPQLLLIVVQTGSVVNKYLLNELQLLSIYYVIPVFKSMISSSPHTNLRS